jgi:hypothetical protein
MSAKTTILEEFIAILDESDYPLYSQADLLGMSRHTIYRWREHASDKHVIGLARTLIHALVILEREKAGASIKLLEQAAKEEGREVTKRKRARRGQETDCEGVCA